MTWNALQAALQGLSTEQHLRLLKGLFELSLQNQTWLQSQLFSKADGGYLEGCRKKVETLIYDRTRVTPKMPAFREAKQVISGYRKSTGDASGTLDLMLTYVERGHAFTHNFGDMNQAFYNALGNMLTRFAKEIQAHPAAATLYHAQFRERLLTLQRTACIGWSYGDCVFDIVEELEEAYPRPE